MNRYASQLLRLLDRMSAPETVSAHCDIPCGIYDPHAAQIGALTVLRMNQLMAQVDPNADKGAANSFGRYVQVKEEHAETVKNELAILWHDYFKPEHLDKYPDLHQIIWDATKLASKCKQTFDEAAANDLLAATNRIAEIFWDTKGVPTRKSGSNQAVGGQLVYVNNQ